jgi:hypothetical protein
VLSIVARHQPQAVFYHNRQRADARWGGTESGAVPYPCWATFPFVATDTGGSAKNVIAADGFALLKTGDPDGAWWMPAMADAPLRGHGGHEWFWEPGDECLIQPLDRLVDMYCRSVGHNATLILGITPDTRGRIPDADVDRLREFGDTVGGMFGQPIAETVGEGEVLELPFAVAADFDLVVLQEDIRSGERVRGYELQVRLGGGWRPIDKGPCIGHKHIHRLDAPQHGDALRLGVERSRGTPRIRRLAVCRAGG